jgi:hypothetical protein
MAEPHWDDPEHLMGLPCTNWKKRLGYEMRGTVAQCVARWLDLPGGQMRWSDLCWGDPAFDRNGQMGSAGLAAYVLKHGVPPHVAAARGGQPPAEALARMVPMHKFDPGPGRPQQPGLEYSIYKGKKK